MFGLAPANFHVDFALHDDTVIDLGGCCLRALHTPGHVSGALCYYEPDRQRLFTADTIFAGGILGGIFASGSNSDYLWSLRRLQSLRIRAFFPGHGRNSQTPHDDIERGILASEQLASDTRSLFDSMRYGTSFDYIMRGTAAYAAKPAEASRQPVHVASSPAGSQRSQCGRPSSLISGLGGQRRLGGDVEQAHHFIAFVPQLHPGASENDEHRLVAGADIGEQPLQTARTRVAFRRHHEQMAEPSPARRGQYGECHFGLGRKSRHKAPAAANRSVSNSAQPVN